MTNQIEDIDMHFSYNRLIKDFVVIGRGLWVASPEPDAYATQLTALIIEWEDGSRIGLEWCPWMRKAG